MTNDQKNGRQLANILLTLRQQRMLMFRGQPSQLPVHVHILQSSWDFEPQVPVPQGVGLSAAKSSLNEFSAAMHPHPLDKAEQLHEKMCL